MAEHHEKKEINPTDSKETHTKKVTSSSTPGEIGQVSGGDSASVVNDTAVSAPRREEPVTSSIHVVSMNANGPNDGPGSAARRKQAISNLILKYVPGIVLFQEFTWQGCQEYHWTETPIPIRYRYTGNTQAGILYDADQFQMTSLAATDLERPLDELRRKAMVPQDFMPLPRCCIRLLELAKKPICIVISWHGISKMSEANKKKEFQYLLVYLNALAKRQDLPILVGGDFNIRMSVIKNLVIPGEFVLYEYTPLERRLGKIIDFFLSTPALTVADVKSIDILDKKVLDHDPISATCTVLAPYHRKNNPSKDIPRPKYPCPIANVLFWFFGRRQE